MSTEAASCLTLYSSIIKLCVVLLTQCQNTTHNYFLIASLESDNDMNATRGCIDIVGGHRHYVGAMGLVKNP